ncbi:hypothetical protein GCM10009092_12750 [Bowmanella denitrificans]|uniref:Solute-binding protein family 3/N-terminal domain-containing protein n=2 Tax=Bowmanella denitrificans TaxID=366582 RepID=A0ABP3GRM8_9ALTE
MHRCSLVTLMLLLTSGTVFAQEKPALEWCLDHLPPRQFYQENSPPHGPMVDMMKELAARANFELRFSLPTPIERCLKRMQAGNTDLMTGLLLTQERAGYLYMLPFDEARSLSWFVNKERVQDKALAATGRNVTLMKDRFYDQHVPSVLQQNGYQVRWSETTDEALAELFTGVTDVIIGPQHILEYLIASQPRYQGALVLQPSDLTPVSQVYLAISRKSASEQLQEQIAKELKEMVREGKTHFYTDR